VRDGAQGTASSLRQPRDDGDLSYVQFQLLARLGQASEGSHRMTDLADGVVYSRSGLTYQAGLLEKAGLITRSPSLDDERGVTVTITDTPPQAARAGVPGPHRGRPPDALRAAFRR
jgi:DNA-binding MarR family transcriptional regulator